jgi:putative membrane protein
MNTVSFLAFILILLLASWRGAGYLHHQQLPTNPIGVSRPAAVYCGRRDVLGARVSNSFDAALPSMRQPPTLRPYLSNSRLAFSMAKFLEVDKEADRKNRRTVFNSLDWKRHRESSRYFNALTRMPFSQILKSISKQVLGVTVWSVFVVAYNLLVDSGSLRKLTAVNFATLSFPSLPLSLISPSLGLMLMFRTNAAYDRWNKARLIWASIVTKSSDLMRAAALWVSVPALQSMLVRYVAAFSRCLRWYLTYSGDTKETDEMMIRQDLNGILNEMELQELLRSENKLQHILMKLSRIIVQANLSTPQHVHMEKLVCDMSEMVNNCEMIYSSPIPLIYTRHSLRFLLLWLLTVPITLFHEFRAVSTTQISIFVPSITFIVAALLFGVEELGVQIEEPFSLLPLGVICKKIQHAGENILSELGLSWELGNNGAPPIK